MCCGIKVSITLSLNHPSRNAMMFLRSKTQRAFQAGYDQPGCRFVPSILHTYCRRPDEENRPGGHPCGSLWKVYDWYQHHVENQEELFGLCGYALGRRFAGCDLSEVNDFLKFIPFLFTVKKSRKQRYTERHTGPLQGHCRPLQAGAVPFAVATCPIVRQ